MKCKPLILMFLLPSALIAQVEIPAGTILPLRLETRLEASKLKPGAAIRTQVMQNVPDTSISKGGKVLGHVISATPMRIAISFDSIEVKGKRIPIKTNLRAIASMTEVDSAQIPQEGDAALSASDWTTRKIGGEEVYRGGGPVARGVTPVGESTPYGVLAKLNSSPPCRGAIGDDNNPQALWLFSTDACGVYGFDDLSIGHSGRTDPIGTIVLASNADKVNITTGSGLLLRVQSQ